MTITINDVKQRNFDLDVLRSLGTLIVLLVHSIFWNDLWPKGIGHILSSFVLIEMPLLFAVTGASNFLSQKHYLPFLAARLRRILIPYWIYAILCVILITDQNGLVPGLLLSWLNPYANSISGCDRLRFLNWALWFIPVYLNIMILFPLLKKFYVLTLDKKVPFVGFLPLIAGIGMVVVHDLFSCDIPQYQSLFYLTFVYWGMVCINRGWIGSKRKASAILGCLTAAALIVLFNTERYGYYMLANKNECNLVFMLYGLLSQCVMNLLLPFLSRFIKWIGKIRFCHDILSPFRDYGYSVYLYHPLIFASIPFILSYVGLGNITSSGNPFIIMVVYFSLMAVFSPLLAKYVGKFELICSRKK